MTSGSITSRTRLFARLKVIEEASGNRLVIPGVNAYNQGDYGGALSYFLKSVTEVPAFRTESYFSLKWSLQPKCSATGDENERQEGHHFWRLDDFKKRSHG